jgi:SAM-dependent methyltransferase
MASGSANSSKRYDPRQWVRAGEEWWFDASRRVKTAGDEPLPAASQVTGEIRDSHVYAPVRAANAHAALRDLPVNDFSQYTFVDIGSGKGRMLFVAAEYPFRRVLGVEYAGDLHEQAKTNLERYNGRGRRCSSIESIHADAAEFAFPNDNLIVYLFNPFGPEVMGRMLENLERSVQEHPRHVVLLMLWPEYADVVERANWLRVNKQTRRYHIYQTDLS